MNVDDLIGAAAAELIATRTTAADQADGTARFLLDRLTDGQVGAICRAVASHPDLGDRCRLRIPRAVGNATNLPAEFLTDDRTTFWRNADCDRPILILANTDDDQGQSLKDVTSVGSEELLLSPEIWVGCAAVGIGLPPGHAKWWEQALRGLQEARPTSLEMFAGYVLQTQHAVRNEGTPVVRALGWALPAIRAPRDSAFFNQIPEKSLGHASRWRRMYAQLFNKRAIYLKKESPNRQAITSEQLRGTFAAVRSEIDPSHYRWFEEFIEAEAGWCLPAENLAKLEWELDKVKSLFDGLRVKAEALGKATLDFYEDEFPETLSEEEREHLGRLDKRQTRESNDDDQQFYENHRRELGRDRSLKAKWDRFVYGQPVECSDFSVGILRALERLFEQAEPAAGRRRLKIESSRRSKRECLDANYDAASYFSRRYRGFRSLTGSAVQWDVPYLFEYEKLIAHEEARGKYERNRSTKRASLQFRFTLTLEVAAGNATSEFSCQVLWNFNPASILSEYQEDWLRVAKHPFGRLRVARELVSKKGRLQSIELKDVSTLMPVFRQDRGSLVAAYDASQDLERIYLTNVEGALAENCISGDGKEALSRSWEAFASAYRSAVSDFLTEGVSAESCLSQAAYYEDLLKTLSNHALGDRNRSRLVSPVLRLGAAEVEGGEPAAIVTPWHPLRLVSACVKARYLCGLIRHLMSAETVNFGDARLFFRDIGAELLHPYYPEVCLGTRGHEPIVLSVSETLADYSLMECPVRRRDDGATTNEDPQEAACWLLGLVRRYLELQPHEAANLSAVLYNCDTARLPEEAVNALSQLYEDEDDVRCQVILRHSRPEKLSRLYEALLETAERDSDSVIASESARDFMARLRIGIMADQAVVPSALDGPPADIVFMQDVISRTADFRWTDEDLAPPSVDVLEHVPPRWSRRRPATRHDLKSTTYLSCPTQPSVGWAYLRGLCSLTTGEDVRANAHPLPSRQINFSSNETSEIFDEVHRLGQWVVNHDELLTKSQLRNMGVQIIRYQQNGYEGRSLIVSSKASLNLLHVLVQKRLNDLNLGLDGASTRQLAEKMIADANDISGDIVLRAGKRACFANELMGLVLSRFLLSAEIGDPSNIGWYFLDDYAGWLGQKQEHIADILALSPRHRDGRRRLVVMLSEAKYVAPDGLSAARRTSEVQLRETQARVQEAIFGDPGRLDRDLWLARLADLLLDRVEMSAADSAALAEWRDAIRNGTVELVLRGYSHVFVHGSLADGSDPSHRSRIGALGSAWQEVFGRDAVRALVLAYRDGKSPEATRRNLGGDGIPPGPGDGELPARRVNWAALTRGHAAPVEAPPEPASRPAHPSPASEYSAALEPPVSAEVESGARTKEPGPEFAWAARPIAATLRDLCPNLRGEDAGSSWLSESVSRLRTALLSYSLQAKVIDQRLTPNAALVRLQGSDRLKVSDIEARRGQLLTTHELRVIRVSADPGSVVVALARPDRQTVSLVEALRDRKVDANSGRSNQSLIVGVRESDGSLLYLAPGREHAPHTLVAGTTGSGKSVLLQNLILDVCMTNSPTAARLTLIDPKQGVDYFAFETLPHLDGGIIVEQAPATAALESLVLEMDQRYRLFREARATNLGDYNSKVASGDRLPVRWIVHDEFAEWMLVDAYRDHVSNVVQRLGVKARAAGIFLIFAAQRPEDRVMPVQLRDNLGNRLILRVESEGTSRISLGEEGAERLLGKGHLAARLQGEDQVVFAQVPILDSNSLESLVRTISGV